MGPFTFEAIHFLMIAVGIFILGMFTPAAVIVYFIMTAQLPE